MVFEIIMYFFTIFYIQYRLCDTKKLNYKNDNEKCEELYNKWWS